MRLERHPADRVLEGRDAMEKSLGELEELSLPIGRLLQSFETLADSLRPLPVDLAEGVLLRPRRGVEKSARENAGNAFGEILAKLALILAPDDGSGRVQ